MQRNSTNIQYTGAAEQLCHVLPTQRRAKLFAKVLDWLLPRRCLVCQIALIDDSPCCEVCYPELPFHRDCCARCGQSIAVKDDYCGRCVTNPPPFESTFCAFRYQAPISDQIHQFKYAEHPELASSLAKMLVIELLESGATMPDLLVPVPLHISRLRQRGYNQAALLCRHIGNQLGIPVNLTAIKKAKPTQNQAALPLAARQTNVRNSFVINGTLNRPHISIIDDVFTTGSTAMELSRILKKAGAETVQVWALAYTK